MKLIKDKNRITRLNLSPGILVSRRKSFTLRLFLAKERWNSRWSIRFLANFYQYTLRG